ncbi:hypothetical protein [Nonomuraea sp. NPDC003804]|uniref:hypothetical protein n=1 Tax=Nonomuraea sp. NPDC003804 TaxID=3154547 RepID=UPI0033B7CD1E
MTEFSGAHMGDKIRLADNEDGWLPPVLLISEPQECEHGSCLSCRGVTPTGVKIPVHAAASRQIEVLEQGPVSKSVSEFAGQQADRVAEDADRRPSHRGGPPIGDDFEDEFDRSKRDYDDTPNDEGDDN